MHNTTSHIVLEDKPNCWWRLSVWTRETNMNEFIAVWNQLGKSLCI